MTENFWKKLRNTVKSMNMNLCGFVKIVEDVYLGKQVDRSEKNEGGCKRKKK
mgnify:CR=1 FL=1